ncbi:VWA domain-containing protein [Jeotgalibacillus sp. JSM ZJ347]|uniref:vWA domain-containing protein n=1 Tax=Jeotgalibacillus sp. JSM ZJ347 TaxID=3342117 RepID=UPI0035A94B5B
MNKLNLLLPVSLAFLLVACQESEQETEQQEAEQQETGKASLSEEKTQSGHTEEKEENDLISVVEAKNLPDPPSTERELFDQSSGISTDTIIDSTAPELAEQVLEEMRSLPALSEDATEEELDAYYKYFYSLVAFDFPDPQTVVDQMQFQLSGTPEADPQYQFKENYNIEIILDASGSMGAMVGSDTRMEQAKKEINEFLSKTPEEANVSLRVYGHEGTGDDADKAMSCGAIEEVYERGPYDEAAFQEALDKFEPAGWTPVAGALESSAESFADLDGEQNTNLIYLVSDGIETCDGDPVKAAESFAGSNVSPIINVIGFNADSETQAQLKEVADTADGMFTNVSNAEELAAEFDQTEEILKRWREWKRDAKGDVLSEGIDARGAIVKFSLAYHDNRTRQVASGRRMLYMMEKEGLITRDQQKYFQSKSDEVKDLINDTREKYDEKFEEMRDAGLAEMEQKIEELAPDEAE